MALTENDMLSATVIMLAEQREERGVPQQDFDFLPWSQIQIGGDHAGLYNVVPAAQAFGLQDGNVEMPSGRGKIQLARKGLLPNTSPDGTGEYGLHFYTQI